MSGGGGGGDFTSSVVTLDRSANLTICGCIGLSEGNIGPDNLLVILGDTIK
jgi:hypothetical protein